VRVLEEDDGSGWVKVADSDGEKGLVPATYLEDAGTCSLEKSEPFQQNSQQASGIYGMSITYFLVRSVISHCYPVNSTGSIRLSSSRTRRAYDK
jgi:uncharacterized protein YgiM (DUF1202 family)